MKYRNLTSEIIGYNEDLFNQCTKVSIFTFIFINLRYADISIALAN